MSADWASASAQIGAECAEMAAWRDPGTAWHDGADDRDEGGQQDRQQDEAGPHRRSGERQQPIPPARRACKSAPTTFAADCRASSSGRSPGWRRAVRSVPAIGPRPNIHGSNCQSPRAQRWWRIASTS